MNTSGYIHLVHEILLTTHWDLQLRARKGGQNFRHRQDALAFLDTEWFETLCQSVDLNPSCVRKNLIRVAYRTEKQAK
ncbi:hypothetical protein [Cohnella caldifontis]|uniref:hypothetical protein n=1 Tax=Cohnella caldifontis TaxID=3027471 RepID=UPI0023EB9114|nr:hypothetical protein [Cohnella sp. YIM B05605]